MAGNRQKLDRPLSSAVLDDLPPGGAAGKAVVAKPKVVTAGAAATGAAAAGSVGVGALALISVGLGALAVGAIAAGAVAIGRLSIGRARIRKLHIDELVVGRLIHRDDGAAPPGQPKQGTVEDSNQALRKIREAREG